MFSLRIVNSGRFLKLPPSTQALYFHLCMRADDDGIVEAYTILNVLGTSETDLKVLVATNFIRILNEDLVSYILDWNEHNLIRLDRKVDSIYQELLVQVIPDAEITVSRPRIENRIEIGNSDTLELPYSFNYKITKAFIGKECPVCGSMMSKHSGYSPHKPTVQHNKPRSLGGTNTLDNISVICHKCNVSMRNKETGSLNNKEVRKAWAGILGQSNDSPMTAQVRLGKDSIGKDKKKDKEINYQSIIESKNLKNYRISIDLIDKCHERVLSYMESSGRRYKNITSTIRNWLIKDADNGKLEKFVFPDEYERNVKYQLSLLETKKDS